MNSAPNGDDDLRDDFLRAALRHAPDREARPPEAVHARILQSARRATAPAPWWLRLRHRVNEAAAALGRPGPAAAFASLMLATVIGVMWRDGPPPEEPRASDVSAPLSVPSESPPQPQPQPPAAVRDEAPPQSAPLSARADRAERELPKPARPAAPPKAAAAAPQPEPLQQPQPPQAVAPLAAPAQAPPADGPPSEDLASKRRSLTAPAGAAAAARSESKAAESQANAAPREAVADPLGPLAAGSGARLAAVIDDLRRLTQGRWERVSSSAPVTGSALAGPDGAALGSLQITEDAVLWQPRGMNGQAWRAPLPAGTAAGLRARLAEESTPPGR